MEQCFGIAKDEERRAEGSVQRRRLIKKGVDRCPAPKPSTPFLP